MMKKKMSILSLVFQLCASLALFLPFVWVEKFWQKKSLGFTVGHSNMRNFFYGSQYGIGFFGTLTLITGIISAAVIALYIAKKISKKNVLYVAAAPTVCLIVAVLIRTLSFYGYSAERISLETKGFWEYEFGWLLYIIFALQIAASALSVLLELNVFSEEAPRETPQSVTQALSEYKDLLDAGVITEEEFDAKKKQLLGL